MCIALPNLNYTTGIQHKPVGDVVHSLLTIGNALFSPIFLQSCSLIHESGSDNPFQRYRYGHSKFCKMAGLLDLVQPEVGPFNPPYPKTIPRIKYKVGWMIRCRDMAIWNFNLTPPFYSRLTRQSCVHWAWMLPFHGM